jgi:O-antigen/teichoic acid export membrane protein
MTLQWAGPTLAVVTLLAIGFGHVMVRRLNYFYGTKPAPIVAVLGLLSLFFSLRTANDLTCAVLGVVGVTTLWDAVELYRQEERVRRGHAPANPDRPVEPRRR